MMDVISNGVPLRASETSATRTPPRPTIGVAPFEAFSRYDRLLAAVSEIFGVQFVATRDPGGFDAAILFGASFAEAVAYAKAGARTLAYVAEGAEHSVSSPEMTFGHCPGLSRFFHEARLPDSSIQTIYSLEAEPDDQIAARCGSDVVWLQRNVDGSRLDLLAVPPPRIGASEYLFSRWHDASWFALLPILQVAQEISGWKYPEPRACFMFDDPNLHWGSYGFVRFAELSRHAAEYRYHAAFATVPMDGWYAHRPTARLFRDHSDRLSLLIHGNDHTYHELHRTPNPIATAAQALRRIELLERRANVRVSRVMAAPHGACSDTMARGLLKTGFEAACISRSSLMSRNPGMVWPVSMGLHPAAWLGGGLPVIPRFSIRGTPDLRARFAMLLGQPVIVVGHHHDLRDGLGCLEQFASRINSIAPVQWTDMTSIARGNYLIRRNGGVLTMRTYARKAKLAVPEGTTHVRIERPWAASADTDNLTLHTSSGRVDYGACDGGPIAVPAGDDLIVSLMPAHVVEPRDVAVTRSSMAAIARRQLCEARDRLHPILSRLAPSRRRAEVR